MKHSSSLPSFPASLRLPELNNKCNNNQEEEEEEDEEEREEEEERIDETRKETLTSLGVAAIKGHADVTALLRSINLFLFSLLHRLCSFI